MVKAKKSRKRLMRIGGIISIVIGVLFLLQFAGIYTWIPAGASALSTTGQTGGISLISTRPVLATPLAQVGPSGTYIWRSTVTNTGIKWTDGWFCSRVLINGAVPTLVPSPDYEGELYYVGKCGATALDRDGGSIQCRENIEASAPVGWDMKWRIGTTGSLMDASDSTPNDQVFCQSLGVVNPGESRTWEFTTTVPSESKLGTFPVISTAGANVQGVGWIIASKYENLEVGAVTGSLVFGFIGSVLSILGIVALAFTRPF